MPSACNIIVVPEDCQHRDFVRGYLRGRGINRQCQITQKWTGKNGNFDRVREWFVKEIQLQSKNLKRFGVIALIDADAEGAQARRKRVLNDLADFRSPAIEPCNGRMLIIPVRNIETWMIWGSHWVEAGRPTCREEGKTIREVDETHDYKKWRTRDGHPVAREDQLEAFKLGAVVSTLNPLEPPVGLPPALLEILRPLGDFLNWVRKP